MEMSNNVEPNLYRERNQLHSSMQPSMLFIRVSVLLNQALHPPNPHTHPPTHTHTHTHTHRPVCSHRLCSCMLRYKVAPQQQKGRNKWARGGYGGVRPQSTGLELMCPPWVLISSEGDFV